MYLNRNTALDVGQAKSLSFHLAGAGGSCHRCRAPLDGGGEVSCRKCQSLNLNW